MTHEIDSDGWWLYGDLSKSSYSGSGLFSLDGLFSALKQVEGEVWHWRTVGVLH